MGTNKDEKVLKYIEYKHNPIKFMEECIYIPTPGGSELIKLYEPQKKVVKEFLENHNIIILKSRQIGISTICQAIITYIFVFFENCIVGVVSRKGSEASDFCRKVEDMIDHLPDWIRPKYQNKSAQYFILTNGCALFSAAISPSNPGGVFRSKSITLLVVDEAAHAPYIEEAWTGMASTLSKAQLDAKEKGIPYGTIILSTPNKTTGIGGWFYKMWTGAKENTNGFKPIEIHWSEIPVFKNDPEWYKKQCQMLNNDKRKIAQELELQFIASEDSLFNEETQIQLQTLTNRKDILIRIEHVPNVPGENGNIYIFEEELDRKNFYLIGIDCASAAGKDYSAIEVMEYFSGNQVLEYRGKIDPKLFAIIIKYIVQTYCPNSQIIIENTGGYGHAIIYDLFYDEEFSYNLFGIRKENSGEYIPGISTNVKTRQQMIDALYTHVTEHPDCIRSPRLATELLNLTGKTGKIEADKGFNDDLAMAFAFCCFVRKYYHEDINPDEFTEEELKYIEPVSSLEILDELSYGHSVLDIEIIREAQRRAAMKSEEPSNEDFEEEVLKSYEDNDFIKDNILTPKEALNINYDNEEIDYTNIL